MSVDRDLGVSGSSLPGHLSAPVRARSILLSTHQLLVEELSSAALVSPEWSPPRQSAAAVLYGFVDVDGVPYLVFFDGDGARPGPVHAVAVGLDDQLGELHVTGELGEWIYSSADQRVAEVIEQHRDCMVEPAKDLAEILRMRVAPIQVSRAWTSPPGTPAEAVDRDSFNAAEPDLWLAFAHETIRHLHEYHHDVLLDLARAAGARGCSAVNLTRLDPGGAILTAMSHEGLMDVVIPFDPPAATPSEAGRRLAAH